MATRSRKACANAQGITESRGHAAGFLARSPRARRETYKPSAHRGRSDARRLSCGTNSTAKAAQTAVAAECDELKISLPLATVEPICHALRGRASHPCSARVGHPAVYMRSTMNYCRGGIDEQRERNNKTSNSRIRSDPPAESWPF